MNSTQQPIPAPAGPVRSRKSAYPSVDSRGPISADASADLLPDPSGIAHGDVPPSLAPGEADDLIAQMADEQIDQLLNAEEAAPPATTRRPPIDPVEVADASGDPDVSRASRERSPVPDTAEPADSSNASGQVSTPAPPLAPTAPDDAASASMAALVDAPVADGDESSVDVPRPSEPVAADAARAVSSDLTPMRDGSAGTQAAADAQAADAGPVAFPASFSPPGRRAATTPMTPDAATPAEPDRNVATSDASPPVDHEPETAEQPAVADATGVEPEEAHFSAEELFSDSPVSAIVADPHEAVRSDAEAVARELAEDLRLSPRRLEPAAHATASRPSDSPRPSASPRPAGKTIAAIVAVPTAVVDVINLPVRSAGDNVREAIGAAAIVTLANAAALLLYLMLFRG